MIAMMPIPISILLHKSSVTVSIMTVMERSTKVPSKNTLPIMILMGMAIQIILYGHAVHRKAMYSRAVIVMMKTLSNIHRLRSTVTVKMMIVMAVKYWHHVHGKEY